MVEWVLSLFDRAGHKIDEFTFTEYFSILVFALILSFILAMMWYGIVIWMIFNIAMTILKLTYSLTLPQSMVLGFIYTTGTMIIDMINIEGNKEKQV